jgi:hypothetical protein
MKSVPDEKKSQPSPSQPPIGYADANRIAIASDNTPNIEGM